MTRNTWGARTRTQTRKLVAATYGMTCHLCGHPIHTWNEYEVDHITPQSAGGTHDLANLRPAHGARSPQRCNQRRGDGPTQHPTDNRHHYRTRNQ